MLLIYREFKEETTFPLTQMDTKVKYGDDKVRYNREVWFGIEQMLGLEFSKLVYLGAFCYF